MMFCLMSLFEGQTRLVLVILKLSLAFLLNLDDLVNLHSLLTILFSVHSSLFLFNLSQNRSHSFSFFFSFPKCPLCPLLAVGSKSGCEYKMSFRQVEIGSHKVLHYMVINHKFQRVNTIQVQNKAKLLILPVLCFLCGFPCTWFDFCPWCECVYPSRVYILLMPKKSSGYHGLEKVYKDE